MADYLTPIDVINARVDVKTLEKAANGLPSEVVNPRLGGSYKPLAYYFERIGEIVNDASLSADQKLAAMTTYINGLTLSADQKLAAMTTYINGLNITAQQKLDIINGIVATGNTEIANLQSAINTAAAAGAGANGWTALVVQDASGKNQQQINDDIKSLTKTTAAKFSNFASALDAAPIIQAYANSLNDGDTLLIPTGNWAIKSACIINKAINVKCDGQLVIDGSPSAYLSFERAPSYTLSGTSLSQLPKKGDTKLFFTDTSTFDPATHYVTLSSTEVEIVRIGYAAPYYKNETLDFIDSNFNLRGQIDLDYTDASKLTLYVYKKKIATKVQLNMSMQPISGQTTGAKILNATGVNNIIWDVNINREASQKIAGTSFGFTNCVHFTFMPSCSIVGGQADTGDSYAFLNSASSYLIFIGGTYVDVGITTKKERGYASRHGKYVYFQNCSMNGIDEHYGHWYTVKDMRFVNRGVSLAGGSILLENVQSYAQFYFLFAIRNDAPYSDGKLTLRNCYARGGLLNAELVNDSAYASRYKAWDEILIENCSSYSDESYTNAIRFSPFFAHNTNSKTALLRISNFKFTRKADVTSKWLQGTTSVQFTTVDIEDVTLLVDGTETNPNQMASVLTASAKISLKNVDGIDGTWTAPKIIVNDDSKLGYCVNSPVVFVATDFLQVSNSTVSDDCTLYASSGAQNAIYLYNNKFTGVKFLNASFMSKVEIASGNGIAAGLQPTLNFDLQNYSKTMPLRYSQAPFTMGTLAVGTASAVQTVSVKGARLGNPVDATITTNANGLKVVAWVSQADEVKYFVENPAANPLGSQTITYPYVRLTVRS